MKKIYEFKSIKRNPADYAGDSLEDKYSFFLTIVDSLRGMIYPEIKIIIGMVKKKKLILRMFLDRDVSDFDEEVLSNISTSILSDYDMDKINEVDEKCIFDKDIDIRNIQNEGIVFYQRMEKDQYSLYE